MRNIFSYSWNSYNKIIHSKIYFSFDQLCKVLDLRETILCLWPKGKLPTPTYTATSLLQLLAFWYHSDFFSFSLQLAQKTTARLLTRSENRRRITEIPASKLWLPVSCILKLKTLFFVYTALILALSLSVNPCPHITLLDTSDPPIKDSPLSRDQGLNVVELSFLQPDVPDGLLKKTVKLSSVCSPHSIDDFNVKKTNTFNVPDFPLFFSCI